MNHLMPQHASISELRRTLSRSLRAKIILAYCLISSLVLIASLIASKQALVIVALGVAGVILALADYQSRRQQSHQHGVVKSSSSTDGETPQHRMDRMSRTIDEKNEALLRAFQTQEREAAYLARIIASTGQGIVVIEEDGSVARINPIAERILSSNIKAWPTELSDVLARVRAGEQVEKRVEIDNSQFYEVIGAPVITSTGTDVGAVITLRDITSQVLADQMRTNFLLQMSHELNTPLAAAKGSAEVAYMMLGTEHAEVKQFLVQTLQHTNHLNRMVKEILDVGALMRGGLQIERHALDFTLLVDDVVAEQRELIMQRGHTVRFECAYPVNFVGDAARLKWALRHLLRNACQYTLPGGDIEIGLAIQRGILIATVKDNGVGISAFDQQHIFEQFYRSAPIAPDGTVLDYRGAGLGLFIVDQVAKAHDGRVSVISEIGAGSEFVIEMPISTE